MYGTRGSDRRATMGAYDQGRTACARSRRSSVHIVGDRQLVIPDPQHGTQRSAGGGAAPAPPPPRDEHTSARRRAAAATRPIYERWSKTRMANVVTRSASSTRTRSFRTSRSPIRSLTFKLDDVAFVYGTKWKQRYFTKVGDDYFPLPAQWDVTHKVWRAVLRAAEHRLVGAVLSRRQHEAADRAAVRRLPLGQLRHADEAVTEWNVGCERCHGPGSEHVRQPSAAQHRQSGEARLRARQRHVHPVPLAGAAARRTRSTGSTTTGRSAFIRAATCSDFWKLEEHKLGETTFTHFADGTAHKNRMQGNDFVQSVMYRAA